VIICVCALWACAAQNRPLQLISGAGPVHPPEARADGVEGVVAVRYDVDVDGTVINARVVNSEPAGVFDEAALRAVRSWRFNARIVNGEKQVARNIQSTVSFKLAGADDYDQF